MEIKVKVINCIEENLQSLANAWLKEPGAAGIEIMSTETVHTEGGSLIHIIYYKG